MKERNSESINTVIEDEISFKELMRRTLAWIKFLLKKWILFLLFAIVGAGIGFFYSGLKKTLYVAKTSFVLEDDKGGGLGSLAGLASMAGVDISNGGSGIFQGDNIIELYKSRLMIKKCFLTPILVNKHSELLVDYFIDINKLKSKWINKPILKQIDFRKTQNGIITRAKDSLLNEFIEDINKNYLFVSKPDKKLSILEVIVKSNNEIFAKEFNTLIVQTVNDFYLQTKTKKAQENVKILQLKTDSVRGVMNGAIYAASRVSDNTPNINPTRQTQRVAPIQRSQFSAETNKAVLGELVKNLEMSKISLLKEKPLLQIIDQPVYPLDTIKLTKLKGSIIGAILFTFILTITLSLYRIINESFKQ